MDVIQHGRLLTLKADPPAAVFMFSHLQPTQVTHIHTHTLLSSHSISTADKLLVYETHCLSVLGTNNTI